MNCINLVVAKLFIFTFLYIIGICPVFSIEPKIIEVDDAKVVIDNDLISVKTGIVNVKWNITDRGLKMIHYSDSSTNNQLNTDNFLYDWSFIKDSSKCKLINVSAELSDDSGFTNKHIKIQADFNYSDIGLDVRYEIWAYPNANGIRTQLYLKNNHRDCVLDLDGSVVEALSFKDKIESIQAFGYYNDTQNRNKPETPILKELEYKNVDDLIVNWASVVSFQTEKSNFIVVKESPKCVNQQSFNSGGFQFSDNSVSVYGPGLDNISLSEEFKPCWATWILLCKKDNINVQSAIKEFDRVRYPVDINKDLYIMANTWGSGDSWTNCTYAAREENVLRELQVASELGVDVLQIDAGWQGPTKESWFPVKNMTYNIQGKDCIQHLENDEEYNVYPEGWKNVKQKAAELGIKLGLWAAVWIPYDDLIQNFEQGGFKYYKLDFAYLDNYAKFYSVVDKMRKFILYSKNTVRVNWDVTENHPRFGYFYGREYGNIYLENRKTKDPKNVIYTPWLILRDAWHVSKYVNLNKFQVTFQNLDLVDRNFSDAYKHRHSYCLAMTLMGDPIFFQEIHLLSESAKKEIQSLLDIYKANRLAMYNGYVYPIGDEPTNASWSGFQNHDPLRSAGFITVFREINNKNQNYSLKLRFLRDEKLQLTDLITNEQKIVTLNNGVLEVNIQKSGGFKFYKYENLNN